MKGFVSKVIVLAIILVSMAIIINNLNPIIDESRDVQKIDDAKRIMQIIDSVTNQLSIESTGAQRALSINLPQDARFIFSGSENRIKIRIDDIDVLSSTGRIQEENVVIQGGGALSAYEADIDNDGDTDLVLENPAVLFAVHKLGSESSHVAVDTANIISLVRNKRQNVDMVPKSSVMINEKNLSSYGTGYTRLSLSDNVQSASIIVHMNSAANITYNAIFTLSSNLDFVELRVQDIEGQIE